LIAGTIRVAAHGGADEKRTNDARVMITRASNIL